MKNIFEMSEDEKNRIRGLHEAYKQTQGGLIIEQDETAVIKGCMDEKYKEYNAEATEDSEPTSCKTLKEEHVVKGCIDKEATNYNAEANTDDGSCTYAKKGLPGTEIPCDKGMVRDPKSGKCVKDEGQFNQKDDTKDEPYDRQNPQQYQKLQNQLKALYDKAFLGKKIALYKGKRAAEKDKDIKFMGIKIGGMKETPTVKKTSPKMLFDGKEMSGMEIPTNLGNMTYKFEFDVNERGDNKVKLDGKTRYFSGALGKVMDKIENIISKMNKIREAKPKTDY